MFEIVKDFAYLRNGIDKTLLSAGQKVELEFFKAEHIAGLVAKGFIEETEAGLAATNAELKKLDDELIEHGAAVDMEIDKLSANSDGASVGDGTNGASSVGAGGASGAGSVEENANSGTAGGAGAGASSGDAATVGGAGSVEADGDKTTAADHTDANEEEAIEVIEIPEDWKTMDAASMKVLANNFVTTAVASKVEAITAIQAELDKRAAAQQ